MIALQKIYKPITQEINNISMKLHGVKYIRAIHINGICSFRGYGGIFMGSGIRINSGWRYNPIGGQERMILVVHNGGKIVIGNNVGMSNSIIVSKEEVIIEDDVMIGGSCKIYDTDFHSIDYEHRMETPDTHIKTSPVHIKKGAFIGAHSIVLKGVTIGEKSVIGAGSVVAKDVPDGEIWAGNPARFIKKI